jgi:hypothetical protein
MDGCCVVSKHLFARGMHVAMSLINQAYMYMCHAHTYIHAMNE